MKMSQNLNEKINLKIKSKIDKIFGVDPPENKRRIPQ